MIISWHIVSIEFGLPSWTQALSDSPEPQSQITGIIFI